ncbi:hypothetical protein T484DRAFT_1761758 [Baffinella frigidus]|nr:hypothetical protein T484DRAFT_1761758 [Cryptophyta sp. CCMP2293]
MVTTQPPSTALRVPHTVSLRGKGISDENISTFCQSLPQSTAHLDLSSNEITQEGVEQLVNFLKELPHLRSLSLSDNRIGAEGMGHLGRVEALDLSQNEIVGEQLAGKL